MSTKDKVTAAAILNRALEGQKSFWRAAGLSLAFEEERFSRFFKDYKAENERLSEMLRDSRSWKRSLNAERLISKHRSEQLRSTQNKLLARRSKLKF